MKRRFRNTRGITLVALVVTIIVLLILAAVSINLIIGENGIITRARQSAVETRGASVKEERDLWKSNENINEYASSDTETVEELVDRLVGQGLLTEDEKDQILGNEEKGIEATGKVTIGDKTIQFKKVGKPVVQAFKDGEINVGDYITDYNQNLKNNSASVTLTEEETGYVGNQTYKVDSSTTWRVLGLNEDGTKLMITTGSPIKKVMNPSGSEDYEKDPYLYLKGAEGYYNTNDLFTKKNILDKICKIYDSELSEKVQSMRIEDVTRFVGVTLDKQNNTMYMSEDSTKTPLISYEGFLGESYTYKVGDYAPENYLKEKYTSKYTKLTTQKANNKVEGTAYMFSYIDPAVNQGSKEVEILFGGTTGTDNNAKAYWLASSGIKIQEVEGEMYSFFGAGCVMTGYAGTGYALFCSDGLNGSRWLAVRPIVTLKSDTTVKDLTITESGTEETWTTSIPNNHVGELADYGEIIN